jgi:hypothetical protein
MLLKNGDRELGRKVIEGVNLIKVLCNVCVCEIPWGNPFVQVMYIYVCIHIYLQGWYMKSLMVNDLVAIIKLVDSEQIGSK